MAEHDLFLGIDLSTTGAKALLVSHSGQVILSANTSLKTYSPFPLWSEQNPIEWWDAVVNSIRNVILSSGVESSRIKSIGLTGQMHGLVILDEWGNILRPAILWNDQRTSKQCDDIRSIFGKAELIKITGNDALPGFTAPKILWVRDHEPEIFNNIKHVLLPKDYIRYQLIGDYAMDKADGSGTILFDLKNRDWSKFVLNQLKLPHEWFPKTFEGTEITGFVSQIAAEMTGLTPGIPVVAGGGDQTAQAVGVGVIKSGIVALTLGTSGVVFAATEEPLIEPDGRLHSFCHALPDHWHLMGVMLSAAGSLQWYRDTLAPEVTFEELTNEASIIPAGSEGLFFLPYLTGERTPHPDPFARAAWIGLTNRHSRPHITRSILEGVAFGLKDSFQLIKNSGLGKVEQVRISGGGARSSLWREILASVLDVELVMVNTTEGAAYGAALLAGVGVGNWKDVQTACDESILITGRTTPVKEDVELYQKAYSNFQDLYPALKPTFDKIALN